MSAKPFFIAIAALSQAALVTGCATTAAHPGHAAKHSPTKTAQNDAKPQKATKAQQEAAAKREAKARAEIGTQDILTQMTFWAQESAANPDDAEVALKFSEALRKGGRADRAVEVASGGLDTHPADPQLLFALGTALIDAKRSGEALRPLALVAQADAKDWKSRSALGVALDQQGRFEEARMAYKEALAIKPGDIDILTNFGVSYLLTGEAAKAEGVLKQAAALPDAGPEVRQNLSLAIGLQGRFKEAEQLQKVDLPPSLVANNMAYMHSLLSDDRRWGDLKSNDRSWSATR